MLEDKEYRVCTTAQHAMKDMPSKQYKKPYKFEGKRKLGWVICIQLLVYQNGILCKHEYMNNNTQNTGYIICVYMCMVITNQHTIYGCAITMSTY